MMTSSIKLHWMMKWSLMVKLRLELKLNLDSIKHMFGLDDLVDAVA